MNIGVDFRIVSNHKGGMAVYAQRLINNLRIIDKKNQYFILKDQTTKRWGGLWWLISEQYWLQIKLFNVFREKKFNIGIFLNPPIPFLLSVPIVLTIPDMSFVYDSGILGITKIYLFIMYFISAHRAVKISTFSKNSKNDIIKILKIDPHKIFITPLASPDEICIQPTQKIVINLKQYNINQPFALAFPGTFIPRKNMVDLLLAFSEVCEQLNKSLQLVIVGITEGKNYQEIVQLSKKLGIYDKIIYVCRPDYSQLSSLYCGADIFVCTSLYEGFGLPILEAMKCGTPVISYANSSLTELVGDAGILVKNQTELTTAMLKTLKDKNLRNSLKEKGLIRASAFSWKKTASIFLANLNAI